ncbi:MAG: DUF4922 domain-containing protein [Promethearchaeota archaeon]
MNIQESLNKLWEKNYAKKWMKYAKLSIRKFPYYPGDKYPMIMVHNTLRDQWESVKKTQAEQRQKDNSYCPLDLSADQNKDSIRYGNLIFKININPTLKHHLMIYTHEHREPPYSRDHFTILNFVKETDYAVFLNLRGSGAGIPDHLHYQGQKRKYFPLLFMDLNAKKLVENGHFELWRPKIKTYGLMFKILTQKGCKIVSRLLELLDSIIRTKERSYNLFFDNEKIFLFPRQKEIATNVKEELKTAGMDKWQIAGQEMGYLFTAKTKEIIDTMTGQALLTALKDVTYSNKKLCKDFEKLIIDNVNL